MLPSRLKCQFFSHFTVIRYTYCLFMPRLCKLNLLAIHRVNCGPSQPTANRWEAWCKGNGTFECTFLVEKCTQIGLGNSEHVMHIPDCNLITKLHHVCNSLQCPFEKKKKKKVIKEAQLITLSAFSHCSSNCSTGFWRFPADGFQWNLRSLSWFALHWVSRRIW